LKLSLGVLAAGAVGGVGFAKPISRNVAADDAAAARRYNQERRFAETAFGRIAYIDRGSGPAALFLHGFPLSSFQWRGAIERLAGERRCLAPDLMGLGYTEVAPGQSVDPDTQVEMLEAFLDRLKVDQVDLIANDSGGAIAQLFVTSRRERVRTLLLTNCDVEIDSPPKAVLPVIELAKAGEYADRWLVPWVQNKDLARSPNGLGGICYSNPQYPTDAAIDQYLGVLVASPARKALINQYAMSLAPNPLEGVEPYLGACMVPTRLVWGMSDPIFTPRDLDYLTQILPRVTGVRRIDGAKLFFPEEYPHIIADEARRLWTEGSS
jgi:pimeloyl-ACP methyl ester carboxylesterase